MHKRIDWCGEAQPGRVLPPPDPDYPALMSLPDACLVCLTEIQPDTDFRLYRHHGRKTTN